MTALVPLGLFDPKTARAMLVEVADLSEDDGVDFIDVPSYDAVLIYAVPPRKGAGEGRFIPELYRLLNASVGIEDYNRIAASWTGGRLYLVVAQGRNLLFCNSFEAPDFTTAEYFLFLVLNRLQLNPEVSPVYFRTQLDGEEEASLCRYFKSVGYIE
ncbi:MAG: DUF3822 family protein [Candidatus Cryptobacteroides sp.]